MSVTLCGTSMQSPAAHTIGAEVYIRSSTMIPPADPVRTPAARARPVLASFLVQTTARSHGISPADVATALIDFSPRNPLSVVLKWSLAPFSCQDSCTGAMMSGSVAADSAHAPSSIRCVSMPRWHSAVTISRPSGLASTTTAERTPSRTLSHSIARRMFLT